MNFHPPLSAFPVALISTACLCELAFLATQREWLRAVVGTNLILGSVFTLAAFLSGYQASEIASQTFQISDETISLHHTVGRLLLFGTIPCLGLYFAAIKAKFNRSAFEWAFRVFLILLTALVIATGYLGGQLVFTHGAGVAAKIAEQGTDTAMK